MPLNILSDEPLQPAPHMDGHAAIGPPAMPKPARKLTAETHPHGLYIETFGCQMNAHDTERMRELLEPMGYRAVDSEHDADLIILNSCDIREKAENKLMSALGRYKEVKAARKGVMLAVAGCVAQVEGEKLIKRAPYVDWVVGTDQLRKVPEIVAKAKAGAAAQVENAFWDPAEGLSSDAAFIGAQADYEPGSITAFVTAMTGCDKKCAYCIVPYTRGKERSRPMDSILAEVELLAGKGVKEVMLIGQTVNTYGLDFPEKTLLFPKLLDAVSKVPGIVRVRFMTSHPRDMCDELIETLGRNHAIAGHLHLPVQAGSNATLGRMGRGYTREWYLDRIKKVRAARPDISITTDIIVGFPGETEAHFAETMSLLEEARFDNLFSFAFSERDGTPGATMDGAVPLDVRKARLNILQARQRQFTREFMERHQDAEVEVLVDGPSRFDPAILCGKTGQNVTVNFPGNAEPGTLRRIKVTQVKANTFFGELV